MQAALTLTDRRTTDRREPSPLFSRCHLLGGRRIQGRRAGENRGYLADQHGVVLFVAATALVLLNMLDAYFTILFLSYGGTELNPVVDWVLVHGGVWSFVALKSVGIGLCIGFLTLTKNFTASRVGIVLVVAGYAALLGWHLHLASYIPVLS